MEKELAIGPRVIRRRRNALAEAIRDNRKLPPEKQVTHCVTLLEDKDRMILIDGSAHEMEELFVRFFEERPEMRQVVESALKKRFKIATRLI